MKLVIRFAAILILTADLLGQPFFPQHKVFSDIGSTQEDPLNFWIGNFTANSQIMFNKLPDVKLDSLISTATTGEGSKHLFSYDQNGNMIEWLSLSYFSGQWFIDLKHQFFYENGLKTEELLLGWGSTGWDSLLSRKYFYSGAGLLTQAISRIYYDNSWVLSTRSTYKYNADSLLYSELTEKWENEQWNNFFVVENYYNNRKLLDSFVARSWSQGNWVNYWNTHFYYSDGFIEPDSIIAKTWGNNAWQNLAMRINYRMGNNNIEQIEKNWNGAEWVDFAKRFYERDENRFLEFAEFEFWNGTNWIPENGDLMIDNPDGFNAAFITHQVQCYNSLLTNIDNEINNLSEVFKLYQNYPNPFNPTTKIKFVIPSIETGHALSLHTKLVVFDLLGREVATLLNQPMPAGTQEVEFDASDLPSGVYFYKLIIGNFTSVKKMILLR